MGKVIDLNSYIKNQNRENNPEQSNEKFSRVEESLFKSLQELSETYTFKEKDEEKIPESQKESLEVPTFLDKKPSEEEKRQQEKQDLFDYENADEELPIDTVFEVKYEDDNEEDDSYEENNHGEEYFLDDASEDPVEAEIAHQSSSSEASEKNSAADLRHCFEVVLPSIKHLFSEQDFKKLEGIASEIVHNMGNLDTEFSSEHSETKKSSEHSSTKQPEDNSGSENLAEVPEAEQTAQPEKASELSEAEQSEGNSVQENVYEPSAAAEQPEVIPVDEDFEENHSSKGAIRKGLGNFFCNIFDNL